MNYIFDVQIRDKTVRCRAFTLAEYRDLIASKAKGTLKETVINLINTCTDAKNLTKGEAELLLVKLWAHSIGEVNTTQDIKCSCGKMIRTDLNMNHVRLNKDKEIFHKFNSFTIKFKQPKIFDDENAVKMVISCIDSIMVGAEQIKLDELTDQELQDLYAAITLDDVKEISEKLLENKIYMALPIECECGNSMKVISGLKEFMGMF